MKTRKTANKAKPSRKADPRTAPVPTAPPSASAGALKSLAAVSEAATLAPRKAAKPAPKAQPTLRAAARQGPRAETAKSPANANGIKAEAAAVKPRLTLVSSGPPSNGFDPKPLLAAPAAKVMEAGVEQAQAAFAQARDTNETLRQAMARSATATTKGLVELNGKMLDLMRVQSEATLAIWLLAERRVAFRGGQDAGGQRAPSL